MDIGERVTYYTHEASEADHLNRDQLAFVTGLTDNEDTIDVVVFPPGGPVQFYRVSRFDPDYPYNVVGGSYWRGVEEEAPDLEGPFEYANEPEWNLLVNRQRSQLNSVASGDREALIKHHQNEQEALRQKLDQRKGEAE